MDAYRKHNLKINMNVYFFSNKTIKTFKRSNLKGACVNGNFAYEMELILSIGENV